jgi:hypothetical protein
MASRYPKAHQAHRSAEADAHVDLVAGMFSILKLREPQNMLGIKISRDRDPGTITIHQASKAQSLATAFGVEGERCATPMTHVVYGELQAAREGGDMAEKEAYQSGIDSLLHMAQCVQPDIAVPDGALATFCSATTAAHHVPMLNVHRYVGCTSDRVSRTATPVCPWRCGEMRILQYVSIRRAVCLDGWSCVLGVRCLGRADGSGIHHVR